MIPMKTASGTSAWIWLPVLLLLAALFGVKLWQQPEPPSATPSTIEGPAVLLIRGDNSPDCQAIHRLVDEAAKDYGDRIQVLRLDWSAGNPLIERYQVRFLPSVIFIDAQGRKLGQVVGESPAVQRKLKAALAAFGRS